MMRSWAYNRFGVLMGTSWPASCPHWHGLREVSWPMITLFHSQGDFYATADKRNPYFVLSAIGIPAQDYRSVDSSVNALKRRLVSWAKPEDFEIKGRDLRRGELFFKGQNWPTRVQAIHDVAQLIADLPCRIFAVQLDKRHLPEHVGS